MCSSFTCLFVCMCVLCRRRWTPVPWYLLCWAASPTTPTWRRAVKSMRRQKTTRRRARKLCRWQELFCYLCRLPNHYWPFFHDPQSSVLMDGSYSLTGWMLIDKQPKWPFNDAVYLALCSMVSWSLIGWSTGSTYGHHHGRLPAMSAEHPGGDPVPQDDLVGGRWRRLGNLHHCLHVLLHGQS